VNEVRADPLVRDIKSEISAWKKRLQASDRAWDPSLFTDSQNGDRNAIAILVDRYHKRLAQIIDKRLTVAGACDKEDIFQDTLAKVYHDIEGSGFVWKSEAEFYRWLVLTVTNMIARGASRLAMEDKARLGFDVLEILSHVPDSIASTEASEDSRHLREALKRLIDIELSGVNRSIFRMLLDDQSLDEIAQRLKLTKSSLDARVRRSLRKLRSNRSFFHSNRSFLYLD
jgi:RNA polymerase sigma factor (sigma-70 family)